MNLFKILKFFSFDSSIYKSNICPNILFISIIIFLSIIPSRFVIVMFEPLFISIFILGSFINLIFIFISNIIISFGISKLISVFLNLGKSSNLIEQILSFSVFNICFIFKIRSKIGLSMLSNKHSICLSIFIWWTKY